MQVNFGRREHIVARFLKKNQNAPRPSGHPPVRGFFGLPYASRLHCRFFYRFGAVVVICNCPDTPYIFVTSCPMVSNHVEVEGGSMRVPGTVPLQQPNRVFWLLWDPIHFLSEPPSNLPNVWVGWNPYRIPCVSCRSSPEPRIRIIYQR